MKASRFLMLLILASVALPLHAKRVICVDQPGDAYIHTKEGFERARAKMDGVAVVSRVGGPLKDCLALVANDDEVVIIAHGDIVTNEDLTRNTAFFYDGNEYEGFGEGERLASLPPGFGALRNVKVTFCACYSALDLDGKDQPQKSLLDQLIAAMGGKANHPQGTGFVDKVKMNVIYTAKPESTDSAAAKKELKENRSWEEKPPVNRPEASNDNQKTAAQAIVDAKVGAGKVKIEIADKIYDGTPDSSGYAKEAGTPGLSEKEFVHKNHCECESCDARSLTGPSCLLWTIRPGPPVVLEVLAQDEAEGLCSIHVLKATNASVDVPGFAPGERGPLFVTATKTDQTQPSTVQLQVQNCSGLSTICDPVLSLVVRDAGKPVRQSFSGIPQAESKIEVHNGAPGLRSFTITVNGVRFKTATLRDGEVWMVDAASAMLPGEGNTVTIDARGRPRGSALVVIHD